MITAFCSWLKIYVEWFLRTVDAVPLKIHVFFLPAIIALFSCHSGTSSAQPAHADTIRMITLNKPVPLDANEYNRLHDACEHWYDSALLKRGFNGGMIVAKNGNIVFEAYHGTGHLPGHDTVNENTPFHIASVSKTFTAMAVLKLWQDGKLNIDDEAAKYLIGFNYPGITVRTLLNHRSGLPNYIYFMEDLGWDKSQFIHNSDVLNYLIERKAELKNIAPPNVHFTYCNTNYALLALIVEKITGKKFQDYLKQSFFFPLGMKNSFIYNSEDSMQVNPSYDWKGRIMPFNFLDRVYGDKNVYTTPRDMLTWDRALSSGKIFKQETLDQAFTPYSNEKPGIRNYGLGWRMNIFPTGRKMIYHNGWWHGNNASFIRLIEDSATIIVLGNKFNRAIYHAHDLANLFGNYYAPADEEGTENLKTADSFPIHKRKKIKQKGKHKR